MQVLSGLQKDGVSAFAKRVIGCDFDSGGSGLQAGQQGWVRVPFACTVNKVTVLGDATGSIVIDVWNDTYANFPPTDADSMTASAPPTLSSASKSEDSTLTGWDTTIAADSIILFNIDSVSGLNKVTIELEVSPT